MKYAADEVMFNLMAVCADRTNIAEKKIENFSKSKFVLYNRLVGQKVELEGNKLTDFNKLKETYNEENTKDFKLAKEVADDKIN